MMKPRSPRTTATMLILLFIGAVGLTTAQPIHAQKKGTTTRTIKSSGKDRQFLLHIPRKYKKSQKKTVPLVIMLHGRGGSGKLANSAYYGWNPLSEKEVFIVAYPTALGTPTSWKGAWRGKPTEDSKFLAELIDLLLKELRIDKDRVFMTGHSSGGFMSFSFASTHSEKVAAIGPVAGLLVNRTRPKSPVSVISFHGMADKVVPYGKAGTSQGMGSAVDSADFFAKRNKCNKVKRRDINNGKIHIDTYAKGKNKTEVQLYSIEGGGHGWPQKRGASVAATPIIWKFFKDHPRPTRKKKK